jgi:hypothetical protein
LAERDQKVQPLGRLGRNCPQLIDFRRRERIAA